VKIVALDLAGRPAAFLEDSSPGCYSPISAVREHAKTLYLGSFQREGIGVLPAP